MLRAEMAQSVCRPPCPSLSLSPFTTIYVTSMSCSLISPYNIVQEWGDDFWPLSGEGKPLWVSICAERLAMWPSWVFWLVCEPLGPVVDVVHVAVKCYYRDANQILCIFLHFCHQTFQHKNPHFSLRVYPSSHPCFSAFSRIIKLWVKESILSNVSFSTHAHLNYEIWSIKLVVSNL